MPKRSPEDILRDIEESDAEEAADRAASMTPAERRKQLEAAGVGVDALHAKADEWHDRMQRAGREQSAEQVAGEDRRGRQRSRRGRVVFLVAAAAIAAVFLGVLLIHRPEGRYATPAPPSPNTGAADAAGATPQTPGDAAPGDAGKTFGLSPVERPR
jgi:hypothetical protein